MQRWHDVSCRHPDVKVSADQTPRCHACGKEPQIAELERSRSSGRSSLSIPLDKRLGDLDLWWPRSVPYFQSSLKPDPESEDTRPVFGSQGDADEQPAEDTIYKSTLGSDEFRLVWLDSADTLDSPLHLNLCDYKLDDCPEYETVSYTWAGEGGDSTPCKPVYFGPFWDIMLQTKNCWEMLRFVRPWYGNRIVWVDAICINQADIQEGNIQVANMSRIYSSGNRVILYLGPDIAMPLYGKHPRRRRLHEIADGTIAPNLPAPQPVDSSGRRSYVQSPGDLKALLGRRYFSRIWVIQELLLSQRAVMRVGDVDFWTDPTTSVYFSINLPEWSWEQTDAAWMQYISQGAASISTLRDLLLLTSHCRATDPRDRLFGLLSIMPDMSNPSAEGDASQVEGSGLHADYSLSSQHVYIGLFAYCLLNLGHFNILYHASGNLSRWKAYYPTWAPDWTSRATRRALFDGPELTSEQVEAEIRDNIQEGVRDSRGAESDWYISPTNSDSFSIIECWGPASTHAATLRPWYKDAHIDASTGALSMNLTHYMSVPGKLRRVGRIGVYQIFAMKKSLATLFILSEHRIDKMVMGDGRDELFILSQAGNYTLPTYLLLRRSPNSGDRESYNFLSACPFVQIQADVGMGTVGFMHVTLKDLQYSVYDILQDLQERLDYPLYVQKGLELTSLEMKGLFVGIETNRQILPLIRVLHSERVNPPGDPDAFVDAYLACLSPEYKGFARGSFLQITFSTNQGSVAETYFKERGKLNRPEARFRYRVRDSGDEWRSTIVSQSKYKQITDSSQPQQWIDICFKKHEVRQALTLYSNVDRILDTMDMISASTGRTGEGLWLMVTGDPGDECKFICHSQDKTYLDLDTKLCDYFGMDGSTFMVSIE
ncbi:unnamed protein product [Clonostachys solani]|uniref:Heterokaryon incompatibility domain-containing protein n=1 Tax=Clonostachys solani TaxID=160281 RepID=A0A9N9Z7T7_9HYPO|nr:unnamed protein product [Clonostachys solani]